jgi:hypothetical protein
MQSEFFHFLDDLRSSRSIHSRRPKVNDYEEVDNDDNEPQKV